MAAEWFRRDTKGVVAHGTGGGREGGDRTAMDAEEENGEGTEQSVKNDEGGRAVADAG